MYFVCCVVKKKKLINCFRKCVESHVLLILAMKIHQKLFTAPFRLCLFNVLRRNVIPLRCKQLPFINSNTFYVKKRLIISKLILSIFTEYFPNNLEIYMTIRWVKTNIVSIKDIKRKLDSCFLECIVYIES